MARKYGSSNKSFQCTACGDIKRTFPAISHHIVEKHDGEAQVRELK